MNNKKLNQMDKKELEFLMFKLDINILKRYYNNPYEYLKDFLKTFLKSGIYNYKSVNGIFQLKIPNKEFNEIIEKDKVYSTVLLLSIMYNIPLSVINDFNSDYVLNIDFQKV